MDSNSIIFLTCAIIWGISAVATVVNDPNSRMSNIAGAIFGTISLIFVILMLASVIMYKEESNFFTYYEQEIVVDDITYVDIDSAITLCEKEQE